MAKAHFNKQKDGILCHTRTGKKYTLLNPDERGRKYAVELRSGRNIYNGKPLTKTQKAHRSGYLKSREDNARAFKSDKNIRKMNEQTMKIYRAGLKAKR